MGNKLTKMQPSHLSLAREDVATNPDMKQRIHTLDEKVQQMLLWSNLCAIWSYLILIIMIARLYSRLHGQHTFLMVGCLTAMYLLLAILLLVAWRKSAYKRTNLHKASKTYLDYQIKTLSAQSKLISFYLTTYAILLAMATAFFLWDVQNGLKLILKVTAPVSIVTYLLGIYFIIRFNRQRKKLELLDSHLDHIAFTEKISQN